MKYDIITIGDASEDVFIRPHDLKVGYSHSFVGGKTMSFELGEKIQIDSAEYACGGSAANVAVGMSRLGFKTSVLTVVGCDLSAQRILQNFEAEDVDTGLIIQKADIKTNFSVVINTETGERTIFVYHGLKDYSQFKAKRALNARWFFLGPTGENSENVENDLVKVISERSSYLAWNPGALQIRKGASNFRHLLRNTTVLFLNREEAIKFTNYPVIPKDEEVLKRLHSLGASVVVLTNGNEGAKVYDGKHFYRAGIIDEGKRVDATGAGDSYATGFLGKMMLDRCEGSFNHETIIEALKYAVVNSTSVVGEIGGQKGLLSSAEIEQGIAEHPRLRVEAD